MLCHVSCFFFFFLINAVSLFDLRLLCFDFCNGWFGLSGCLALLMETMEYMFAISSEF